jgi:hypothetical protein
LNFPVDAAGMEKNDCKNYKGSFGVTKRGTIFLGESGMMVESLISGICTLDRLKIVHSTQRCAIYDPT